MELTLYTVDNFYIQFIMQFIIILTPSPLPLHISQDEQFFKRGKYSQYIHTYSSTQYRGCIPQAITHSMNHTHWNNNNNNNNNNSDAS